MRGVSHRHLEFARRQDRNLTIHFRGGVYEEFRRAERRLGDGYRCS